MALPQKLTKSEALEAIEAASVSYRQRYLATIRDKDAEARRLTNLLIAGADMIVLKVRFLALGPDAWPLALLECYQQARRSEDRHSCVLQALFEARDSAIARELGVAALNDRAYSVRLRAHQVLAYSLDRSVLSALEEALGREARAELKESLRAAIDAIKEQNHDLYKDRKKGGNVRWVVKPWEGTDPLVNRSRLKSRIREIVEAWSTEI